jgi:hypothetical protein
VVRNIAPPNAFISDQRSSSSALRWTGGSIRVVYPPVSEWLRAKPDMPADSIPVSAERMPSRSLQFTVWSPIQNSRAERGLVLNPARLGPAGERADHVSARERLGVQVALRIAALRRRQRVLRLGERVPAARRPARA